MLNLCGAKWEPRFVDFFNGETRTPEYGAINEMGEVPVLEHRQTPHAIRSDLTTWPTISVALVLLFSRCCAESYGTTTSSRAHRHAALYGYACQGRRAAGARVPGADGKDFLLGILDPHLSKSDFVGEGPTIMDLSICGYLYRPDEFGVSWTDYPRIGAWLERIRKLPGWVHPYELMPGHPLKR